jgi:hypothetical protein
VGRALRAWDPAPPPNAAAGWKSSIGLPDGSSRRICWPRTTSANAGAAFDRTVKPNWVV